MSKFTEQAPFKCTSVARLRYFDEDLVERLIKVRGVEPWIPFDACVDTKVYSHSDASM